MIQRAPILRDDRTYTTDRDTYHVRTFLLAPFWHYASVLTGNNQYVPGLDRLRCYGQTPERARLGAVTEIHRYERRVCDFGDGRAA